MIKQLCCESQSRRINLGWASFQPDGAISFGLNDKTFISPQFKARHFVWSAYNRARIRYEVASDPATLEAVQNPHFTFHPPIRFHLKADGASDDEVLFDAIAEVDFAVQQKWWMPWIRATSGMLRSLPAGGLRPGNHPVEQLVIRVPDEELSVRMALDFIRPGSENALVNQSTWCVAWHGVALRIAMSFTHPHIPTLSWFHFY